MSGPGTFFGLQIALRGLMANQKSLDVTGHNIANANTPGYSRQEAVHITGYPYPPPNSYSSTVPGQLGSGVEIETVRRIRNEYLDNQYRDSTSAKKFWDGKLEVLEQIESIFPEPDGRGIQKVMIDFFSNWQDLNNSPQDTGVMAAVVESGKELARLFRDTHNQLQNVNDSIIVDNSTGKIPDAVNHINELTTQIAELTRSIIQVKREGRQPNDLLDKRDLLLDKLAGYGPLKVETVLTNGEDLGGIRVTMFDGLFETSTVSLVDTGGTTVTREQMNVNYDIATDTIRLDITGETVNLTDLASNNQGTGSLLGMVLAWQKNSQFTNTLNTLVRELGEQVNLAYDPQNPAPGDPVNFFFDTAGNPFSDTVGDAGDIRVKQQIIDDPGLLDGTQALNVARLRNDTFPDLGDGSLENYYQGLIAQIGTETKSAQEMLESQKAVLEQVGGLKESVSGVSLDEEMTKMMQFQYAYQASARVMSTMDTLLDTIINRMAV